MADALQLMADQRWDDIYAEAVETVAQAEIKMESSMNPVDLIIFGATGDLSARKLFPALFSSMPPGLLQADLRIAAVGVSNNPSIAFKNELRSKNGRLHARGIDESVWQRFVPRLDYLASDFAEPQCLFDATSWLDDARVSLFYLATPPSLFATICEQLSQDGCLTGPCRIVLEKPIGESLETSRDVNDTLAQYFDERDIYRIDHYLGKETVQNLLVFGLPIGLSTHSGTRAALITCRLQWPSR